MNLYQHISIISGVSVISTLVMVNSSLAGIESKVVKTTHSLPGASPSNLVSGGFATPDDLVKQLAIDTIQQSEQSVRVSKVSVPNSAPVLPKSKVTSILPNSSSGSVATCPIHICPPVSPLSFPAVPSGTTQKSSDTLTAKPVNKVEFNKSKVDSAQLVSPLVSKSLTVEPIQGGTDAFTDIAGDRKVVSESVATEQISRNTSTPEVVSPQSQIFAPEVVLNAVVKVVEKWDLASIGERIALPNDLVKVASPLTKKVGSSEDATLIGNRQLFMPLDNQLPQWIKVAPAPNYQFSPGLTLGGFDQRAIAAVDFSLPVKGQFQDYLLSSVGDYQPAASTNSLVASVSRF